MDEEEEFGDDNYEESEDGGAWAEDADVPRGSSAAAAAEGGTKAAGLGSDDGDDGDEGKVAAGGLPPPEIQPQGGHSRDSDGAPRPPRPPSETASESSSGASSAADRRPKSNMSAVNILPSLPPGISISGGGGPNLPACISVSTAGSSGGPSLPPGLTIRPVKDTRQQQWGTTEDEDDARSTSSQDRGSEGGRGSTTRSGDRTPRVGAETTCVMCLNSCGAERRPKLLNCLHSCCGSCFAERLAAAKRENSDSDVVDLEDDVQGWGKDDK